MSFLVLGGQGFVGANVIKKLLERKLPVYCFDYRKDDNILQQIVDHQYLGALERNRVYGDVSSFEEVLRIFKDVKPRHVIHLAALQIPACRENPIRGSLVNVTGTLNVFEATKHVGGVESVVFASSAAVTGAKEDYSKPIEDNTPHQPRTHYGYFKLANEGNARIYWQDHKIKSIALRPHTVYGVGREVGVTSGPTKAIKAAILGRKYALQFTGNTSFNFVEDVADVLINCATAQFEGAHTFNMKGEVLSAEEYLKILHQELPESKDLVSISPNAVPLPLAYDFKQTGLDRLLPNQTYTPLLEGIRKTARHFRELHKRAALHDRDL